MKAKWFLLTLLTGLSFSSMAQHFPPTNLECCPTNAGQFLSWAPVQNAVGYEVVIIWGHSGCCRESSTRPNTIITTTENFHVMPGLPQCFGWQVRARYQGGEFSEYSDVECPCGELCRPPVNLRCTEQFGGSVLSWDNVPGAFGYEVEINWKDDSCCRSEQEPNSFRQSFYPTTNSHSVFLGPSNCFSWKVRTFCGDDLVSDWAGPDCSCARSGSGFGNGNKSQSNDIDGTSNTIEGLQLAVAPVPSDELVEFKLQFVDSDLKTGELTIMDVNERIVYSSTIELNGTTRVNVQGIPDGMYFYSIDIGGKAKTGKILVQH